jgi:hypothetical protein
MKFFPTELPQEQFEVLGIKKEDLRALPHTTYQALLSGNRTSLMRFYFHDYEGEKVRLDAKLSLQRNENGKPVLMYHPVRNELKNNFNLSEKDFKALKNDEAYFVEQTTTDKAGKKLNLLVSVDKTTNELVAIDKDALQPPISVNGVTLSKEQQADFLKGKTINANGAKFKLNPNNEIGVDAYNSKIIKTRNGKPDMDNMLFDLTLVATGLGGVVLLEHLLHLARRYKIVEDKEKLLKNEAVRNALAKAAEDFKRQKESFAAATGGKTMNDLQGEHALIKSIHKQLLMLPDSVQQEIKLLPPAQKFLEYMKLLPEAQKFLEYPNPNENDVTQDSAAITGDNDYSEQNEQTEKAEEAQSSNFKMKR